MSDLSRVSFVGMDPLEVLPHTRQFAHLCRVTLSAKPTAAEMHRLVEVFGPNRTFDDNVPPLAELLGAIDDVPPLEILGLMKPGAELLLTGFGPRNIYGDLLSHGSHVLPWVTAGTANWSRRRVTRLEQVIDELGFELVDCGGIATGGERECTLPTETHVGAGTTESGYLFKLLNASDNPGLRRFNAYGFGRESMAEQVQKLAGMKDEPFGDLAQYNILVPVNAGALNVPLEMVTVLARVLPRFDPARLYFTQDSFKLAVNQEQVDDREHFQRPLTFFSAWARLGKAVFDLNQQLAASDQR